LWQALDEEKYLEVNIKHHIAESFREDLEKAGFVTSAQLKRKRNGEHVKIAGRVVLIQMSPTRSGIRIMFITIEDEQQHYAKKVLENLVVLCEGTVRRLGITSVVIKKVIDIKEFYGTVLDQAKSKPNCQINFLMEKG